MNIAEILSFNLCLVLWAHYTAISITFRIIKRFNFIYRILVLLKYLFNLWMSERQLMEWSQWNWRNEVNAGSGATNSSIAQQIPFLFFNKEKSFHLSAFIPEYYNSTCFIDHIFLKGYHPSIKVVNK